MNRVRYRACIGDCTQENRWEHHESLRAAPWEMKASIDPYYLNRFEDSRTATDMRR